MVPELGRWLALLPMLSICHAQYSLKDYYSGSSFFDGFTFFTSFDPTHGFVNYVDQATAQNNGLISTANNVVYIGTDYTSQLDPGGSQGGRQSVRLTGINSYTGGLFIGDFAHMPGGQCGSWPAFWTVGGNWPNNGEIDITEGVNSAASDLMSLHTGPSCTVAGSGQSGTLLTNDCYQYSASESGSGCGTTSNTPNCYGTGFNNVGGGVYAMEWTPSAIRTWFFPRSGIPADITGHRPDPSSWGTPMSNFQGDCNISSHFAQHQIVIDQTFCGDWAGAVWSSDATCSRLAASCDSYVASNPSAFKDAYWAINYIGVYQSTATSGALRVAEDVAVSGHGGGGTSPVSSTLVSSTVPVASTSPVPTIAHDAAGATAQPPAPGVTPPASGVGASSLSQAPATANSTRP